MNTCSRPLLKSQLTQGKHHIKKLQDDESHRKAFAERINYVFLEGEHS